MRRRQSSLALLALLLLIPARAAAEGFDSELFKPATSSTSFLSQSDAEVLATYQLNLGISFNVSSDPLVLRDAETGEALMDGVVVSRRTGTYLTAGIGLPGPLELGLALPVVIAQSGNGAMLEDARDVNTTSIGDLRTELKARLLRHSWLRVALAFSATIPLADDNALFTESGVTGHPRLLLAAHHGPLRLGADVGLRMRETSEVAGLRVDDELTAGLGASLRLVPDTLWMVAESYARRAVKDSSAESTPAEALLGARYRVWGPYQVMVAGGVGIGRGYGAPAFRGLLAVDYVPGTRPAQVIAPEPEPIVERVVAPPAPVDSDGDGVLDPDDSCPKEAEDMDDFEDEDGCPDLDNDEDSIADLDDACPLEAEVVNGINDTDGCPDEGIIVMIKNRIVLEEKVLFDMNRSRVKHEGRRALQAIVTLFQQHPEWIEMRVEGHADSSGPADFNMELSQRRAERVRDAMIKLGMDPAKITHQGFGETVPLVEGKSEEAMQKNRRVEFIVVNAREEVQERTLPPVDTTPTDDATPTDE